MSDGGFAGLLDQALTLAAELASEALYGLGTSVSIYRPGVPSGVDPQTAEPITSPTAPIASGVPAAIGAATPGGLQDVYPGAPEGQDPRVPVFLLPEQVDLLRGDRLYVEQCRDPRMLGRHLEVTAVLGNSVGAVRQVLAVVLPERGRH